jgi:mannose-1-phosphate guanylyltransferase/mannose-6-phosphate isomerase
MAGGVGTRLWPISRRSRPKQFQPLLSDRSMLVDTYQRVLPLTSPDRVWVVTGAQFLELARQQLPDLPPGNILGEPIGRSSAPAVALAAARIARHEPEALVLATPSDSFIGDPAAYRDYVAVAAQAAAQGFVATLGVIASHPDTGYGYIRRGERLAAVPGAYRVERFTEKPDAETAQQYLADGGYYWNMGQFIFGAAHFMKRCAVHLPEVCTPMQELALLDELAPEGLARVYAALPTISFDHGIAEKEEKMAVVPTALEWSDVGNWRAIKEIAGRHGSPDLKPENHVGVGTRNCFVLASSGRLVVTVGVEGYVIVDTDDALLIVHEDKAQQVKEALEEIERKGKGEHL